MNNVEKFDELLRTVGITQREDLVSRFAQTLEDGDIESHWNIIGTGCFKVVVELNDKYVLKFVGNSNDTEGELTALEDADNEGFEDILIKQVGFALSHNTINLLDIIQENECAYILIQEKIFAKWASGNRQYTDLYSLNMNEYLLDPLIYNNGAIVSFDKIHYCGLSVMEWLQDMISWYGDDYFDRFLQFMKDYSLSDTHYGNIGYTFSGRPIIFDWYSY